MKQFDVPLLFIIFNRPELTKRVFEAIRHVQPKHLFIAADGPRADHPDDTEKCAAARAAVRQVDWDCTVQTLFRDDNLGCGKAVSSALTWFFSQVEEGMVLEDDCLPHPQFFPYCEEMLRVYRTNSRVLFIGGNNFQEGKKMGSASYYFSAYNHIWGWASWRRAWECYDYSLAGISWDVLRSNIEQYGFRTPEREYWKGIFERMKSNPLDTWDYQFTFSIWNQAGLCAVPNVNLVSNIGFGEDATHTKELGGTVANLAVREILPIQHPAEVRLCRKADVRYFKRKVHWSLWKKYKHAFVRSVSSVLRRK